jgi:hypothetical protein
MLAESALFDANFYLISAPDVMAAGDDPLLHYCRYGAAEDRAPNAYFDPRWYRATYRPPPETTPLTHYVRLGEPAGGRPGPLFDAPWYRRRHALGPDVSPLRHYLRHCRDGKVSPLPQFDAVFYARSARALPPGRALRPGRDPFLHYLAIGATAGLAPSP